MSSGHLGYRPSVVLLTRSLKKNTFRPLTLDFCPKIPHKTKSISPTLSSVFYSRPNSSLSSLLLRSPIQLSPVAMVISASSFFC